MSSVSTAAYLSRRAVQKERVRILYRGALKDTLNSAVHRHLFHQDASNLRERFDANMDVEDFGTIDRLIADGEASYNKWRHPDPYIGKSPLKLLFVELLVRCYNVLVESWFNGVLTGSNRTKNFVMEEETDFYEEDLSE